MDKLALKILTAIAKTDAGTITWTDRNCRCAQLHVGTMSMLPADYSQPELGLMRDALRQLVAMGFLEPEGDQYRITLGGRIFANTYNLLDQEDP